MLSRLAPEFGPAVRQLISKAMSVPWLKKRKEAQDIASQEKRLLLLLTDQEPEARQLLQQHLFKAAAAELDGEQLSSSNFPGSAFDVVRVFKSPILDEIFGSLAAELQAAASTASGSSSTDSSSSSKDPSIRRHGG
jgi:hypothetical protein